MKIVKLSFTFLACAFVASCSNDVTPVSEEGASTSEVLSEKRTFEEALQIAKSSISMIEEDEGMTRGGQGGRTIDLDRSRVLGSGATRADGTTDTLFYVFNFTDEQGFAVVSANKATEGLLAVTEKDSYDNSLKENGGFAEYMELAKGYVAAAKIKPPFVLHHRIDTLQVVHKGPYVSVKWGQGYPEGVFCPNAIAGCVNVAIAQIMSFFKYPLQMNLTYPNADSASVNLDWNSMIAHKKSSNIIYDYCSADYMNAHSDIAHLCRQIAYMTNSTFNPSTLNFNYTLTNYSYPSSSTYSDLGTSAYSSDALTAFRNFGFGTSNLTNYYTMGTLDALTNGHIVYMSGADPYIYKDKAVGHAWIVDGFKRYDIHVFTRDTEPPTSMNKTEYYNHINWGWSGRGNGYFLDKVFVPGHATSYDESNYSSNYNFCTQLVFFEVYR